MVELGLLHWVFIIFIILIIGMMIARRDTSIVSIVGVVALGLTATGSITAAVGGVFGSFIYAITELLPTILFSENLYFAESIKSRLEEGFKCPFKLIVFFNV